MAHDLGALQRALDGDVVLPGSPEYELVRKPVMARFEDVRPAASTPRMVRFLSCAQQVGWSPRQAP